jgi:hypothetical protein
MGHRTFGACHAPDTPVDLHSDSVTFLLLRTTAEPLSHSGAMHDSKQPKALSRRGSARSTMHADDFPGRLRRVLDLLRARLSCAGS